LAGISRSGATWSSSPHYFERTNHTVGQPFRQQEFEALLVAVGDLIPAWQAAHAHPQKRFALQAQERF